MTQQQLPAANAPISQWLALKEASDFLGVHFTTLRAWADKGDIPVFRTPGGHRRFSLEDLRRFLAERSGQLAPPDPNTMVVTAVVHARAELERTTTDGHRWHYPLQGEAEQARRQRGQQLFALAISYVLKPAQRDRLLEQGRELGWEYGREAAHSKIGLAETGRAVQFFRNRLLESVRSAESDAVPDADDVQIQRLIDRFLDEVLYAVLEGYEGAR